MGNLSLARALNRAASQPTQPAAHANTQAPTHPRARSPKSRAFELAQPTIAWLIAAPPPSSVRAHSTCPVSLAMYSGVAPSV
jgi:hypothetical protein